MPMEMIVFISTYKGFPGGAVVKNLPACNAGDLDLIPELVFLLGEFHGQRSLAGYSRSGSKDLNMTE